MKKTYQSPVMQVTDIQLQQLMAGSETLGLGGAWDGSKPIQSRYSNKLWDDDEDYDELLGF